MLVRIVESYTTLTGTLSPGEEHDLPDDEAHKLVAAGVADPVEDEGDPKPKRKAKRETLDARESSAPEGGATGEHVDAAKSTKV